MRFLTIIRWFSAAILLLGGALLIPILTILSEAGSRSSLQPYCFALLVVLFFGINGVAMTHNITRADMKAGGMREVIGVLVLLWLILPIFAGIPFMLDGMRVADAWFESVSSLTTTGAWLSLDGAHATHAGLIWRATLQWMGGFFSLCTAAAIFVRPEFVGITTIPAPLARGEETSYLRSLRSGVETFLPIYAGLTVAIIASFLIVGVPVFDSCVMALSFIASGGMVAAKDGLQVYPDAAMIPATLAMIVSGINFIVLAFVIRNNKSTLRRGNDVETPLFLLICMAGALIFWLSNGAGDVWRIVIQFFNAVSVLSTNGVFIGEIPQLPPILVMAVIGGAAVSTAGGIKVLRWYITLQHVHDEIWQLAHPSGVRRRAGREDTLGIWIHAICFTLFLGVLVMVITFFGSSLEVGATTAVAVLVNAGPLTLAAPDAFSDFMVFDPLLRFLLALGMIFGRLEMVIALTLFNLAFWKS